MGLIRTLTNIRAEIFLLFNIKGKNKWKKNIKTRKGKDGFNYPYTSPVLVIDTNGKSVTKKFDELSSQFKNIAKHLI